MSSVGELDPGTLQPYLEDHVEGFQGPPEISKFKGGQSNPTFRVTSASGDYVLRRQPPGKLLKSAHAVDREYRVMAALAGSGVPVPRVLHLCEDRDVIGSMFYIMEFCDGRIFWDAAIPEVDMPERTAIYDETIRVLAELHKLDIDALDLGDYGKPGNYFQRQYDRWTSQYRASEMGRIEAMEILVAWLADNIPDEDGRVALVHGDYRLDNMIFDHDEPRIKAILDWELSTLGHPFADVGYLCMQMRMPQNIGTMSGLRGKDPAALGIPTEAGYVSRYCEYAGIDGIDNFAFYVAFSFFRIAAIIQGVARRAVEGNASSPRAAEVGAYVEPMAGFALEAIEETKDIA
jgi:aminoglycoside phosphotransferase (APT) family kinase protein